MGAGGQYPKREMAEGVIKRLGLNKTLPPAPARPPSPPPGLIDEHRHTQRATSTGEPQHVWITDCPEIPGREAGVLLGWTMAPDGTWIGRVITTCEGVRGRITMTLWVEQQYLTPVRECPHDAQ
ncbi:MAG TPA: hypothetical protein VI248_27700 [Kineosporiaceae bacterium]